MKTKSKVLSRVIAIALAVVVGCGMLITPATVEAATVAKPSKVEIVKVGRWDHDAVKITWKSAKNAVKYQVYRATSKNGTYKKVTTTSTTSYINRKLTTGKTYYFKVRGVNKNGKVGSFSTAKSGKPYLSKGKITLVHATIYGVKKGTITFNKVNGASGYQVYESNKKNGAYKKSSVKISKAATDGKMKAVREGLKDDTTYYFKVRAYKKVNGKYVYGAFSNPVMKTTDSHNHWYNEVYKNGELVGYKCNCGETKNVKHTHKYERVRGNTITGQIDCVTRKVTKTYCQVCDKIVAQTPENHLASVHPDEDPYFVPCTRQTVNALHNEFIKKDVYSEIYRECSICHERTHKHSWSPMYEKGYYEQMSFASYYYYCSGCKGYVDNNNCESAHKMDGVPYKYTKKEVDVRTITVWVESKVLMGYKCSCGAKMNTKALTAL